MSFHRDQSREGAWAARFGCTAVATLVGMAEATGGRVGPAIDVDDFRSHQPDQVEGIDLHDARIAAAFYGITLEVHADYGGTQAWTYGEFAAAADSGAILIVQGDHGALRPAIRCDDFRDDHAVMARRLPGVSSWRVSNPLCNDYVTWLDLDMREYTFALVGEDRVNAAVVRKDVPMGVVVYGRELADVAGAVPFYDAPGGNRIGAFSAPQTIESVGIPMDNSDDKINFGWRACVVNTKAINGITAPKIVYVERARLTNFRPVPTPDLVAARVAGFNAAKERAADHVESAAEAVRGMTP